MIEVVAVGDGLKQPECRVGVVFRPNALDVGIAAVPRHFFGGDAESLFGRYRPVCLKDALRGGNQLQPVFLFGVFSHLRLLHDQHRQVVCDKVPACSPQHREGACEVAVDGLHVTALGGESG